ncbi:hypothetical protein BGZ82_004442, partial [Podila clonocystis]
KKKYIFLHVAAIAVIDFTAAARTAVIPDALAGDAEIQCCMCQDPFRPSATSPSVATTKR